MKLNRGKNIKTKIGFAVNLVLVRFAALTNPSYIGIVIRADHAA